ncbi:hypothetical protein N9878_00315 [bacterium]|nr:hypothetical protein [bacterium]
MGQSAYNTDTRDKVIAATAGASHWYSYLPELTPFATDPLVVNTPTKVKVPTTVLSKKDFQVTDIGGGDLRVQYVGTTTKAFSLHFVSGIRASSNNVLAKMRVYRNETPNPGTFIPRKIGVGADTGAVPMIGVTELAPLDTVSIWVEVDTAAIVTFDGTSIIMDEIPHGLTP